MSKNWFDENSITIIEEDGNIVNVERIAGEKDHNMAYSRAQKKIPKLLDGYNVELNKSGGYDISCYIAATNKVVIWPTNINDPSLQIVSMPLILTSCQCKNLKKFLPYLVNYEVYAAISNFKKIGSDKVITKSISTNDSLMTIEKIYDYIKKFEIINSIGQEITGDIREFIEQSSGKKKRNIN